MNKPNQPSLDDDICIHIFSVSVTMVGICLTVIGIIRVIITLKQEDLLIDDMIAVNMIFYVTSAVCSYWSLRTHRARRSRQIMRIADLVFIFSMVFTAFNACFITWAMASIPAA